MISTFNLRISHPSAPTRTGSCAGVLTDTTKGERYLLTCSHVAFGGSSLDKGGVLTGTNSVMVQLFGALKYTGNITYAQLDGTVDMALIQLSPAPLDLLNRLPNGQTLLPMIKQTDLKIGQEVGYFSSLRNGIEWGNILQVSSPQSVNLKYDTKFRAFQNLMLVKSIGGGPSKAISVPGDSGSLLFTKNYQPFAVLIAAGNTCSYAVALSSILPRTKLQFI